MGPVIDNLESSRGSNKISKSGTSYAMKFDVDGDDADDDGPDYIPGMDECSINNDYNDESGDIIGMDFGDEYDEPSVGSDVASTDEAEIGLCAELGFGLLHGDGFRVLVGTWIFDLVVLGF